MQSTFPEPLLRHLTAKQRKSLAAVFSPPAAGTFKSAKGADARRQTEEEPARPSGGALDAAPVLREFLKSAKGADACRQTEEELARPSDGALDAAPVLREFLESAKGADACRQTEEEPARPSGGALDAAPVLRAFLESAKGADASRQTEEEPARPSGGALDAAPVLHVFLKRVEVAESILRSDQGRLWREDAANWISGLLEVQLLVPEIYRDWRAVVRESLHFLVSHLTAPRLASKLVEQLELPEGTPVPFRLLALFARMPALQKLGQILARNRHLDPALRAALSQLENSISDVEFETIQHRLTEELPSECERFAVQIEPFILSEASVSAVVRFTWIGERGETQRGVFKVLKPHIPMCFAEDMDLFEQLSEFLASRQESYGMALDFLPETFREIRLLLEHEIDFAGEQKALAAAAVFYRPVLGVRIPRVIETLCTGSITAMTEECGTKITAASTPADRRAAQLVEALVARPLFAAENPAMFHADPHAGNIMYDDSAQELILLDWALAEFLTRDQRRHTLMLTIMLAMQDEAGVLREIEALSQDASASAPEVRNLISQFVSAQPLLARPRSLEAMRLLDALGKRGVRFPSPLMMFRKALFTLDGVLNDVAGPDASVDRFIFGSVVRHWPAIANYLLSPADWFTIQWSALFYGHRAWEHIFFEPGFLQTLTSAGAD